MEKAGYGTPPGPQRPQQQPEEDEMLAKLERYARSRDVNYAVAAGFAAATTLGWRLGGIGFVQEWCGSLAAVIATSFLVWKTQGYWVWMVVNAALWTALFFHLGLPMLAWLQVSFLLFCSYGAAQWAMVRYRIGFDPHVRSDLAGCVIAAGVFAYSVYAYWNMAGYTGSIWWALELGSVVTAIAAIWMDAYRYRLNWGAWTLSNLFSWPLFWHTALWGPFFVGFVYQAINVVGYLRWTADEHAELRAASLQQPVLDTLRTAATTTGVAGEAA
jgi:hypothetical protein